MPLLPFVYPLCSSLCVLSTFDVWQRGLKKKSRGDSSAMEGHMNNSCFTSNYMADKWTE
jgi:hypothetical protein